MLRQPKRVQQVHEGLSFSGIVEMDGKFTQHNCWKGVAGYTI